MADRTSPLPITKILVHAPSLYERLPLPSSPPPRSPTGGPATIEAFWSCGCRLAWPVATFADGKCVPQTPCPGEGIPLVVADACRVFNLQSNPASSVPPHSLVDDGQHFFMTFSSFRAGAERRRWDRLHSLPTKGEKETRPTCGARTWVTPDEMVTCSREHGHADRHSDGDNWWDSQSVVEHVFGYERDRPMLPEVARDIIASLQRQLDALDPDAALDEAARRAKVVALFDTSTKSADSLQQAVRELISHDDDYALRVQQLGEIRQLLGLSLRESHEKVILSIVKLGLAGASIAARVELSAVPERYRSSVEWEQKRTESPVRSVEARDAKGGAK